MCVCTCVYVSVSVCACVCCPQRSEGRALGHFGAGVTGVFELLNVGGCWNLNSDPHD